MTKEYARRQTIYWTVHIIANLEYLVDVVMSDFLLNSIEDMESITIAHRTVE